MDRLEEPAENILEPYLGDGRAPPPSDDKNDPETVTQPDIPSSAPGFLSRLDASNAIAPWTQTVRRPRATAQIILLFDHVNLFSPALSHLPL